MYNKKQLRVFEILDEIIDTNKTQGVELKRYINQDDQTLRTRCKRAFGSLDEALTAYGYDVTDAKKIPFAMAYDFTECCFQVSNNGHVYVDFTLLFRKQLELEGMGYEIEIGAFVKEVESFLALDRIECFVQHYNEDVSAILDAAANKYPDNQLRYLVKELYGDRKKLFRTYGIGGCMLSDASMLRVKELFALGSEFESLVQGVISTVYEAHERHPNINDCVPDFVVRGTWLDAKLSKSTALNVGNQTITKYRKHTDHLVIIYAIDDTTATDARAKFVHVSEYYPYISAELQRKIDAFVRKASAIKFGGAA